MKSMYPIQIWFLWTVQVEFAKYPGTPSCKMQQRNFISQIPKKPPKPYEIHVPNSDWTFVDFPRNIC